MSRWTIADLSAYAKKRLKDEARARERMQNANRTALGLPATVAQPDHGLPLERPAPREAASSNGVAPRFKVTFVVRAVRPRDWDNNATKFLQDRLIHAGIIPGDGWNVLQGQIVSLKAKSREEEGTTVIIETI